MPRYFDEPNDDIGPNDGSLAKELFEDEEYFDRFQSGYMMDSEDY